ncbi:MAG: O-antigen ligase family protein, partial [Bacteroidota bacterium]
IWLSLFLTVMVLTAKQFLVFRSNSTKVFFVIVSIIMLTGLFFFEPVKVRLLESINYKGEYTTDKVWGGRGIRFMIWASAVELIREKPIIGYGSSSSALEALERRYKEKKEGPLLHMMKGGKRFNAHNQYLEEFLKHGLFLGSFYVIALFLLLVQGIKNKDMTIIFLMFIVLSVSLTETVFELNKGIVFVSFFVPIVLRKSRGTPRIEANA